MSENQKMDLNELESEGLDSLNENKETEETSEPKKEEKKRYLAEIKLEPYDFSKEISLDDVDIFLPFGTTQEMYDELIQHPDPGEDENAEYYLGKGAELRHVLSMQRGYLIRQGKDLFFNAARSERAEDFKQVVETQEGPLGAVRPRFKDNGTKVSGEQALLRIRSLLGASGQITIPLWHSGFWVTLRAPDEDELLALANRITSDKIAFGRSIQGAILSNESVYTSQAFIDFIIDHVVDTSLTTGKDGFLENLSALDFQHVVWGMACIIYPNGFDFARAIIDDDNSEMRVQTGRINVSKLQYTDRSALTDKQKRMMQLRNQRVSPEALKAYKDEFVRGQPKEVQLDKYRKVTLEVPTLLRHLDAGHAWVDGIVEMVDKSFKVSNSNMERNNYIRRQSKATQMRQFDHWVSKISVLNESTGQWFEQERDDDFTIELILADWSKEDDIRNTFFDEVKNYIEESTVSIIAVTTASDKEKELSVPRFEELFPIDPIATFSMLLMRKTQEISSRSDLM